MGQHTLYSGAPLTGLSPPRKQKGRPIRAAFPLMQFPGAKAPPRLSGQDYFSASRSSDSASAGPCENSGCSFSTNSFWIRPA
jgi:hypothetical protein